MTSKVLENARQYGRRYGYIPENMFLDCLPFIEQLILYENRDGGYFYGYPIGCNYCGRPLAEKRTCEGCGA